GQWSDIGRYEASENHLINPDLEKTLENTHENISSTIFQRDGEEAWAAVQSTNDLPSLTQNAADALGFNWADVSRVEISSSTSTYEAVGWRDKVSTE
ncbi:MAG: hypothetical protein ACKVKR_13530, partial [Pseudomonadales bacterium]